MKDIQDRCYPLWDPEAEFNDHFPASAELLPSHLTQLFALLVAAGVNIIHREIFIQKTSATDLDTLRSFVLDKNSSKEKTGLKADG